MQKEKQNSEKMKRILLFFVLCIAVLGVSAQRTFEVDLWQGKPAVKSKEKTDTAKLFVFLPEAKKATGRAVVACPGGGYAGLAMDREGTSWASFFNRQGIALIVLKYRMPHGDKKVPISDAEQAMRLVRANAAAWNINPNDVGIMGSSAGGHLASVIATHAKEDVMPNFQMLFYPVITMDPEFTDKGSHDRFLGEKPKKKDEVLYSSDVQVSRTSPRAMIVLADDDDIVAPANGVNYYFELYKHDVPVSLFVYPNGGHGWGIQPTFPYHLEMLMNVKAWLDSF